MKDVTTVLPVDEVPSEALVSDDDSTPENDGLAWWIYLLIVLLNVGVIGAGVWWFMFRKTEVAVDAQTSVEAEGAMADLEALEEDFAGDFDSLDDEDGEEEISFSSESPATADVQGSSGASDGFDEDFSIDPDDDVDTDEDSWGEFDKDSNAEKDKKKDD